MVDLSTERRTFSQTSSYGLFLDSNILKREILNEALPSVLPKGINNTKKLFSLIDDGPSSAVFHAKCDRKNPYLVFVKANGYVFGYYMPISFIKEDAERYCDSCWIFTLTNVYGLAPMKFPVKKERAFMAIVQSKRSPCLGATTENMQDLWIK